MTKQQAAYPLFMDQQAYNRTVGALPEKARDAVVGTTFTKMVSDLAKPGEQIRNQLTFFGFEALAQGSADLINAGNKLDVIKKHVVYNKTDVNLNHAERVQLPADLMAAFSKLTGEQAHLLHMAVGLAGEAAEMLNQVFNHVFHGTPLDESNVVEEGGDATFYVQGLIGPLGVSLEEMMLANKAKLLGKRYANGYSDAAAQARADKEPGQ